MYQLNNLCVYILIANLQYGDCYIIIIKLKVVLILVRI